MVFEKLDIDVAVGQQADIIQQLARRNGARAFFLDARRACAANSQFQIGRRESDAVSAASSSTLERIGMVVFFSTTPCERPSSRTRSALLTVNSMRARLLSSL